MTELTEIKISLFNRIRESEMPKEDKITLAKYVKEANEIQTKHLLLYGTMVESVSPFKEKQINEMYNSKEVQTQLQELGVVGSTLASMFLAPVWVMWRQLASQYSDAQKQCGTFKISNDRNACIAKARINFAQKRIELLKKTMPRCGNQKNKDKCIKTLKSHLAKEEMKLEREREKLDKLVLKGRGYAGEPGQIVATRT